MRLAYRDIRALEHSVKSAHVHSHGVLTSLEFQTNLVPVHLIDNKLSATLLPTVQGDPRSAW